MTNALLSSLTLGAALAAVVGAAAIGYAVRGEVERQRKRHARRQRKAMYDRLLAGQRNRYLRAVK